jgi:hypothetical protein
LQARVVTIGFDANSAEARQPEDVQNVFGAGGSADDVLANGLGGVALLQLGDGAKGVKDLAVCSLSAEGSVKG